MSEGPNLDRALVSGMAWTAVMRWSSQVISWIATFYVARIVAPADYGVVAMAMIAIGYARMVEDFGLDSIFIQDRGIAGDSQARLAGLVLATGVFFCVAFIALSVPISGFFGEPQVAWAVSALSILFITDSLQVLPRALLQRNLQFGRLAVAAFLQVVVTQAILVAAARAGWGYKALVANSVGGALFVTLLLMWWQPYRISWPRDIAVLARPLLQGWRVLASRLAYYAYSTADQAIVGRVLGKDALGAYSFATTLSTTAMQEVGAVVTKVVPGVFSATQDQRAGLKRYFLLLTEIVAYLTLPMSVGLALTADLVVQVALGPNWDAVVAPLRVLCAYTAFTNAQLLVSHLMLWTGQFRAQMWCTIASAATLPIAFFFAVDHGLVSVAFVWAIVYPLTNVPALIIGFRTISISVWQWLGALMPAIVSCLVMSGAVLAVRAVLPDTIGFVKECAIAVGSGALAYVVTLGALFGRRVLDRLQIVRSLRSRQEAGVAAEAA